MYFSRIRLHENAQRSPDFYKTLRNFYSLHQSVWKIFGDHRGRERDFLYRLEDSNKGPLIYAVSDREPSNNTYVWDIKTKVYKPQILSGTELAFMLRANPVVKKRDEKNKQHRHDVVMEAKNKQRETGGKCKTTSELVWEEGEKWLYKRMEKSGFEIKHNQIRIDGYQQHRFSKRGGKNIRFSTLEFCGKLIVLNPDRFTETLYGGVGPAKGFGCGMMMVRRA